MKHYQSAGIIYKKAVASDESELKDSLLQGPMDSWIRLAYSYSKPVYQGECLMGESAVVIAREEKNNGKAVGLYSLDVLPIHINGKAEKIGYLGKLRVNENYRHKLRVIKGGFESIREIFPDDATRPYWFTSIASENLKARRLLEARLSGMPIYRNEGEVVTLAVSTAQAKNYGLLQPAQPSDVPALVKFINKQLSSYQFSPVLTEQWFDSLPGRLSLNDFLILKKANKITGCIAVWDQRDEKQIIVDGYRQPVNWLRRLYNIWAGVSGSVRLPASGRPLNQMFLSFVTFENQPFEMLLKAIREALFRAKNKGADICVTGLPAKSPLCNVMIKTLRAKAYRTTVETVAWSDDEFPDLDGRLPQPEIAIL